MALVLEDKGRKYPRIRLNTNEKQDLIDVGLTPVLSSNVSAIAKQGAKLIVRFHGGATYQYPTSGGLFARMLNSTSKGRFVWVHLRRKNVPYSRIGNIPMDYDKNIDRDMMLQETELKAVQQELLTIKPMRTQVEAERIADSMKTMQENVLGIEKEIDINNQIKALEELEKLNPQMAEIREQINILKGVKPVAPPPVTEIPIQQTQGISTLQGVALAVLTSQIISNDVLATLFVADSIQRARTQENAEE